MRVTWTLAAGFLRALRKPTGESERYWRFQENVQAPFVENGQVVFTAPMDTPLGDVDCWWLGYELISLADRELHLADTMLRETGRPPVCRTRGCRSQRPRQARKASSNLWMEAYSHQAPGQRCCWTCWKPWREGALWGQCACTVARVDSKRPRRGRCATHQRGPGEILGLHHRSIADLRRPTQTGSARFWARNV